MIEGVKLGLAIHNKISSTERNFGTECNKEIIQPIRKAIRDDSKVSVIEWATIGKRLGVFDDGK